MSREESLELLGIDPKSITVSEPKKEEQITHLRKWQGAAFKQEMRDKLVAQIKRNPNMTASQAVIWFARNKVDIGDSTVGKLVSNIKKDLQK